MPQKNLCEISPNLKNLREDFKTSKLTASCQRPVASRKKLEAFPKRPKTKLPFVLQPQFITFAASYEK